MVFERWDARGGRSGRVAMLLASAVALAPSPSASAATGSPQDTLTPLVGVPAYVVHPDLNGDGRPDLVTGLWRTDRLTVRLNEGHGRFGPVRRYPAGQSPSIVETGDFDEDGREDVAVTNQSSDSISIFISNGDGSLQPARTYRVTDPAEGPVQGGGAFPLLVDDFDGDGTLDIVTATTAPDYLSVLIGNGDGTFRAPRAYRIPSPLSGFPFGLAKGDFDADGDLDVAATGAASVVIFKGAGDGSFRPTATYDAGGAWLSWINSGDVNGDGVLDLQFDSTATNRIEILLGNGDGSFRRGDSFSSRGLAPQGFSTHDLNEDGLLDLAVVNASSTRGRGNLAVFLGTGHGQFTRGVTYPGGFSPFNSRVSDLDGDGNLDVAVVDGFPGVVSVYFGKGRGTFGPRAVYEM